MSAYLNVHGLPLHPLIVHATVVLVPLAALALLASVVPAVRRRVGWWLPAVALAAAVLVPITTHSGEQLRARLPRNPAIAHHAALGRALLPWSVGVLVLALAVYALARRAPHNPGLAVRLVVGVLSVAVAVGSLVQVYRIGDSGARAAWGYVSQTPVARAAGR